VGQVEVEIAGAADTTVVVVNPGWGDGVQANKAGLLEIADLFVVNKADREGVDRIVAEIDSLLSLAPADAPRPSIVRTVASEGRGIDEVLAAIEAFRSAADLSGLLARKRREQAGARFQEELELRLASVARTRAVRPEELAGFVDRLAARETDPWTLVEEVLGRMGLA
jgi:LAO/AO transport system kinase